MSLINQGDEDFFFLSLLPRQPLLILVGKRGKTTHARALEYTTPTNHTARNEPWKWTTKPHVGFVEVMGKEGSNGGVIAEPQKRHNS